MTVKLEDFLYPTLACFRYHEEGKLLEDSVVPLLVSFAKIATGHGFPDSKMVDLARMCFKCDDKIPKTLTI